MDYQYGPGNQTPLRPHTGRACRALSATEFLSEGRKDTDSLSSPSAPTCLFCPHPHSPSHILLPHLLLQLVKPPPLFLLPSFHPPPLPISQLPPHLPLHRSGIPHLTRTPHDLVRPPLLRRHLGKYMCRGPLTHARKRGHKHLPSPLTRVLSRLVPNFLSPRANAPKEERRWIIRVQPLKVPLVRLLHDLQLLPQGLYCTMLRQRARARQGKERRGSTYTMRSSRR